MDIKSFPLYCALIALFFMPGQELSAQINGYVTSSKNGKLPFASIYVKGSTIGTTTNDNGFYTLDLKKGKYILVCEFLGYSTKEKEVIIPSDVEITLNFSLQPTAVNLSGVEVSSDKVNPAYRIIKNAQQLREKNRISNLPQKCDLYMKGNIGLYDTPEKFMGIDIPDTDAIADSMGTNILYLSETVSTLYRTKDDIQEVIHSSRLSGSSAFSFNRGKIVEYSIYEKSLNTPFGKLINPIGPAAFQYYDYKLLSKNYLDNETVNKILVISKNSEEPTIEGILYISESKWRVNGFSLITEGKKIHEEMLDTVQLSQEYVAIDEGHVVFKNTIGLEIKMFGFEVNGVFHAVYTDYEFGKDAHSELNERTSVKFADSSQIKGLEYWNKIRPIKLTEKEQKDYHIKDSIATVHNSVEYKDSMDRRRNKYDFSDVLFGYSYRKRSQGLRISHSSPLTGIAFDPVRGFSIPIVFSISKYNHSLSTGLSYGFSDHKFRYHGKYTYHINRFKEKEITISTGRNIGNINSNNHFSRDVNEFLSLFFHKNYIKFYDNQFYTIAYSQRIFPGLHWSLSSHYAMRNPVSNNTDFSLFYKDRIYRDNKVSALDESRLLSVSSDIFEISTTIDFYPGTKYTQYPNGHISAYQDNYSEISFTYNSAYDIFNADISYQKLNVSYEQEVNGGRFGIGDIIIEGSIFIGNPIVGLQDLLWMRDNGSFYIDDTDIEKRVLGLDPYTYFSDKYALRLHYYHDFHGYLINKIPLLRKLGLTLNTKLSTLYMPGKSNYSEISLGIDRIGWSIIRPFRFNVAMPIKDGEIKRLRYVLGLRISLQGLLEGRVSL